MELCITSKVTIQIIFNWINIWTIFHAQIIVSCLSSCLIVACNLAVKVDTEWSSKLEPKEIRISATHNINNWSLLFFSYSSSDLPPVFRFIWHEELLSVIRFDGIKALMTHDSDVETPQSVIPGEESVWNIGQWLNTFGIKLFLLSKHNQKCIYVIVFWSYKLMLVYL